MKGQKITTVRKEFPPESRTDDPRTPYFVAEAEIPPPVYAREEIYQESKDVNG
jgi:hypothetical protein